ncbi:hypothetical protein CGZ97_01610 [Enemella evansiae]|nr:hypothetical protein CGZ97_01610 [Enemella evansiae]
MCLTCGSVREMSKRCGLGRMLRCTGCGKQTNHERVERIPFRPDIKDEWNRRRDKEVAASLAEIEYSKALLAKLGIAIKFVTNNDCMVTTRRDGTPELALAVLDKRRGIAYLRRDLTMYGFARALCKVSEQIAHPDMDGWTTFVKDRGRELLPADQGVPSAPWA